MYKLFFKNLLPTIPQCFTEFIELLPVLIFSYSTLLIGSEDLLH